MTYDIWIKYASDKYVATCHDTGHVSTYPHGGYRAAADEVAKAICGQRKGTMQKITSHHYQLSIASACKDCRHLNTEPFETQCDGVTPVVAPPDRGCCTRESGTVLITTNACKDFEPRHNSALRTPKSPLP